MICTSGPLWAVFNIAMPIKNTTKITWMFYSIVQVWGCLFRGSAAGCASLSLKDPYGCLQSFHWGYLVIKTSVGMANTLCSCVKLTIKTWRMSLNLNRQRVMNSERQAAQMSRSLAVCKDREIKKSFHLSWISNSLHYFHAVPRILRYAILM